MKFITRQEELILLAIFHLGEEASLIKIRELLFKQTGKEWSVSSVYVPLDRLYRAGLLDASIGKPEARRGGRAVKTYSLNTTGRRALADVKMIQDVMWRGVEGLATE